MSLSTMPDEILILILSCDPQDKGQLYRTALVNCRLANLTRPILLRSLKFVLDCNRKLELDRCQQYLRSCSEHPELAKETRSGQIEWYRLPFRGPSYSEDFDISALANSLIMTWSNIEYLQIRDMHCSGHGLNHLLFRNHFPKLRHLDLKSSRPLSITQALHFLTLPNLREFRVHSVSDSHHSIDFRTEHRITTRVEKFHSLGRPLHLATMQDFLAFSRLTLTSLHIRVPGSIPDGFDSYKVNEMQGAFSPAVIKDMLHPVQATLASLRMRTKSMTWPSYDGSRLDLVDFVSLKDAHLSSLFFFKDGSASSDRNGVCRLLPASIEELTIEFGDSEGLLYSTGLIDVDTWDKSWFSSAPSVTCAWLSELAAHKAVRFPMLRTVTILEDNRFDRDYCYKQVAWQPPKEFMREFERNGVLLKGLLRAP